jgi:ribosomal protein S20
MAIIDNNPFVQNASGAVGKLLVYKRYYDKTVISKMPDMSNRVLSQKQIESNERMQMANRYAKSIYKTEESKLLARIRLKVPAHKSLYHALIKEFLDTNKNVPVDELK